MNIETDSIIANLKLVATHTWNKTIYNESFKEAKIVKLLSRALTIDLTKIYQQTICLFSNIYKNIWHLNNP